jgi:hypothetical protein
MLAFIPDTKFVDESLNGYLLRLADENFLGSINTLLRPTGARFKASYADLELASIAQCHGLDEQQLRRLSKFPTINGSLARGYFLRKAAVAVCSECLRESGYIRQAWHHELITACPTHQVLLMEHCPECGSLLELNRGAVCQCRCGFDLTASSARPADAANLFISSVLMTEHQGQVVLSGLNDEQSVPSDVDKFLLFLANLTLTTPARKNAAISFRQSLEINQACFEIAQDLPARFRVFVQGKVLLANQLESSRFIHNLGTWYKELNSAYASEAYAGVRATAYSVILEQANAPINRKMKQIGAELLHLKSSFTATEAARLLGSSTDRIVSFVKTGKLPGKILKGASVEFCLVERAAVEAQQAAAAGLIAGKDLLKSLNITRRVRERLVECGVLTRVADAEKPLFAKGDYRLQDIQRLTETLADNCNPVEVLSVIGLDEISGKRFSNHQANELYRQIFAGHIRPVLRTSGMQGLAAFKFDQSEINSRIRQEQSLFELTITDLTRITRWKHETIKSWLNSGLLPCRSEAHDGKRRIFISIANLVTFLSTYIVAADAAERMGSQSVWLTKALATKGVQAKGGHVTGHGSERGLLLSADALINVATGRAPDWSRGRELETTLEMPRYSTMAQLADDVLNEGVWTC